MSTTLAFDPLAAQQVESIYRTPDIFATRIAAFRAGNPRSGERVLDVGCGPGFLTQDLGLAVGPSGLALGVDISDAMLWLARQRCGDLPQITIKQADALELPAESLYFDLVCALQVYAYVQDLDTALSELQRVLKPGGRVVILDTDFSNLVWESKDRQRMSRVLRAYDGHVAWPDLPRILPADCCVPVLT